MSKKIGKFDAEKARYNKSVFINCPFDSDYQPTLHAITFAILYFNFVPRSALEETDSGESRLSKIQRIVHDCRFGVHDISRAEADGKLPRFNMPFECGIYYGALRYSANRFSVRRHVLVLDSEKHRSDKTLSDLKGNDGKCHFGDPLKAIDCVRSFLNMKNHSLPLPDASHAITEFNKFMSNLVTFAPVYKLTESGVRELDNWKDFSFLADKYIGGLAPLAL
jgi:hypothetical protein